VTSNIKKKFEQFLTWKKILLFALIYTTVWAIYFNFDVIEKGSTLIEEKTISSKNETLVEMDQRKHGPFALPPLYIKQLKNASDQQELKDILDKRSKLSRGDWMIYAVTKLFSKIEPRFTFERVKEFYYKNAAEVKSLYTDTKMNPKHKDIKNIDDMYRAYAMLNHFFNVRKCNYYGAQEIIQAKKDRGEEGVLTVEDINNIYKTLEKNPIIYTLVSIVFGNTGCCSNFPIDQVIVAAVNEWPVYIRLTPTHAYPSWDRGDFHFNMEPTYETSDKKRDRAWASLFVPDSDYFKRAIKKKMTPQFVKNGVFMRSLKTDEEFLSYLYQNRAQFFKHLGREKGKNKYDQQINSDLANSLLLNTRNYRATFRYLLVAAEHDDRLLFYVMAKHFRKLGATDKHFMVNDPNLSPDFLIDYEEKSDKYQKDYFARIKIETDKVIRATREAQKDVPWKNWQRGPKVNIPSSKPYEVPGMPKVVMPEERRK